MFLCYNQLEILIDYLKDTVMRDKILYITQIITSLAVALFLCVILTKQDSVMGKAIILPFILCALSETLMGVSVLTDRLKLFEIFKKVQNISFIAFWFGFLIVFCYKTCESSDKTMLLATIPFWGAGAYLVYKCFFKDLIKRD